MVLTSVAVLLLVGATAWLRPPFTWPLPGRGVASVETVRIDGVNQRLLIRGRDRSKPVVLFLHGGPGMPLIPYAHAFQRPLERDFVVVQWDRRGTGASYRGGMSPGLMRTSHEFADTVALIEELRRRFGQRKIILVGHSYGAWLGAWVAQQRPDLVRAYVGVGQVGCTWDEVRKLQARWLAARGGSGRASTADLWRGNGMVRRWSSRGELKRLVFLAPEYRLGEALAVDRGSLFTGRNLKMDGPDLPLDRSIPRLNVPVAFFHGRHDAVTPGACARRYFNALQAPAKRFVWFEQSAHFPFLEEPERFRAELLKVADGA